MPEPFWDLISKQAHLRSATQITEEIAAAVDEVETSGLDAAGVQALIDADGRRLLLGTGATYDTSTHIVTVNTVKVPRVGDVVYFQMPATVSLDHSGVVSLITRTDGVNAAALELHDIDGIAHNPDDFRANRVYTVIRLGSEYRLIEPLHGTTEEVQDLVAGMFSEVGNVTYDDAAGKFSISFPGASGDSTTSVFRYRRVEVSGENRILLEDIGTVDAAGQFTPRWDDTADPQSVRVPVYVTADSGRTFNAHNARDFTEQLEDDIRFGGTDTVRYDDILDRPIHRVSRESAIPAPSVSNVGRRYQTNDGAEYIIRRVKVAGVDRVIEFEAYPLVAGAGFQGAINDHTGLPDAPTAADVGKWWLVRSYLDYNTSPFVVVSSNLALQSIAHIPDSGYNYDGRYPSQADAEADADLDVMSAVIYPNNVDNPSLYRVVSSSFVAGTDAHDAYVIAPTDVTQHLLQRIDDLENRPAGGAEAQCAHEVQFHG